MRWIRKRDRIPPPPPAAPSVSAARPDWRSWDPVADTYERVSASLRLPAARDLLELAGIDERTRVLDVGAGTGAALEVAAERVRLAVGVDLSEGMLRAGRSVRPHVHVSVAEAINLPFRDGTFQVVTANFVIAFFTKLDTALHDIKRVLAPGGRFGATWWAGGEDQMQRAWREAAEEAVGREVLAGALRETRPWTHVTEDPARLEGALRDSGFRPVRVEKRKYRFEMSRDDWLVAEGTGLAGRFVRNMLGERGWDAWSSRVAATFAERFPERLVDFREVLLAVATRP